MAAVHTSDNSNNPSPTRSDAFRLAAVLRWVRLLRLLLPFFSSRSFVLTSRYDIKLFSLALLLSSQFVYNSRGVIDGNAIEDLSLVVELTKHIHVMSKADSEARLPISGGAAAAAVVVVVLVLLLVLVLVLY